MLQLVHVSVVLIALAAGEADLPSWSDQAQAFALGPVAPSCDLRMMVTRDIVNRACAALDDAAATRRSALERGAWQSWRDNVRQKVRDALGPMPFGAAGGPLNIRAVSRHERSGYVIENVLFESLPGLDVNASVYLPSATDFPPPWPAVVIPVGHSAKTGESYQIPAQVFARLGYVALTFDPPGMGGEKRAGNDHFTDGARCYLTGHSSNRYFVIDALRCVDYLVTRADVDASRGVGMTGVSGGGTTTMFATLLDDRITASGPSCCAVPNALHPVLDGYAPCAETLAPGRLKEYDDIDLLAAAMPTPVLLMAGARDEVFTESMSQAIAHDVAASFQASGSPEKFSFFLDPGGHAYTVAMAIEFTRWMDRWIRQVPDRTLPAITREQCEMVSPDLLACHPRQDRNIFTINRDLAQSLRTERSGMAIPSAIRLLANIPDTGITVPEVKAGAPSLAWFHQVQEVLLNAAPGIELPATFLYPAKADWRGGAVLYFDDRGRWTDLRTHGLLARITGFTNENTNGPAIFSVDVRGWGDSMPADLRYDLAGWGCRDRWLAYVSSGLGDPVIAMRIRDGLSALAYLRQRPEIDPARIVVGGRGMGGVVALHVAALDEHVAGVFSTESLATFESLAVADSFAWPMQDFLTGVLKHYDLPALAAGLRCPALVANPLSADKTPLSHEEAKAVYEALQNQPGCEIRVNADSGAVEGFIATVLK